MKRLRQWRFTVSSVTCPLCLSVFLCVCIRTVLFVLTSSSKDIWVCTQWFTDRTPWERQDSIVINSMRVDSLCAFVLFESTEIYIAYQAIRSSRDPPVSCDVGSAITDEHNKKILSPKRILATILNFATTYSIAIVVEFTKIFLVVFKGTSIIVLLYRTVSWWRYISESTVTRGQRRSDIPWIDINAQGFDASWVDDIAPVGEYINIL